MIVLTPDDRKFPQLRSGVMESMAGTRLWVRVEDEAHKLTVNVSIDDAEAWLVSMLEQVRKVKAVSP